MRRTTIPGFVLSVLAASAMFRPAGARGDTTQPATGQRELVIVFIGASHCCSGITPALRGSLDELRRTLRTEAVRRRSSFRSVGLSLDWEPDTGWTYLKGLGPFDEISVGRNWYGLSAETLIWRDGTAEPVVPQVVVYEQDVDAESRNRVVFGPRRVLRTVSGAPDIAAWARAGAPLPP
jgi:hypothetical protein